jgi:TatD DNase family protein
LYVDSHAHLENSRFDDDRAQMLARARQAGVGAVLAIGNGDGPANVECAIPFAEQHDWIWATVGIHPHEARLADRDAYEKLARLARHPKVIAWGEIGLDYFYDHSPRDVQQRAFIEQMELAALAKKPIVIHCRPSDDSQNAWDDTLRLLRRHWAPTGLRGILHCFTGLQEHARAALDLGFVLSFAGNITFPKAQNIRQVAAMVPLDGFFTETDSPYLAPAPHRGRRNEPALVVEVARQIAELRNRAQEEIAALAADNFFRFFALPRPEALPVTGSGSVCI